MKKQLFIFLCICSPIILWGKEVPDWKLGVSIGVMEENQESTFRYAKKAGIDYLEVGIPKFSRVDVAEIVKRVADYKKYADQAGMIIWSIHIPFGWDYDISTPDPVIREQCKQYVLFSLEMAKGLGSYQKAIIHPSFEPIDPAKRAEHIKAFRETLKELGPYVEENYKVRLAVEDLPRTCLGNSAAEMIEFVNDIPSVDVCFDTNHLLGEKSEYFAVQLGNRIKTIHVSDYDEVNERHWLPGLGVINWNAVVDALVKANYQGPFLFEVTKAPWEGDMEKFCNDLVKSWQDIKENYKTYIGQ